MGDESEPVRVAVRLKSLGDRVRQAGNIRWSDIRVSGPLGLGYAACLLASEAIGLYDWIYRQAGCTNPQAHDPRYFCPSGEHVISLWLLIAHDRTAASVIRCTHETLAQVLGIRRATVTTTVSALHNIGVLRQGRGSLTIADMRKLERIACTCFDIIRASDNVEINC